MEGINTQYKNKKKHTGYYMDYNRLERMIDQIDYESKTKYPKNKVLVDLSKLLKRTTLPVKHKLFIATRIVKILNTKFTDILNMSTPEFKFVSKEKSSPPPEISRN